MQRPVSKVFAAGFYVLLGIAATGRVHSATAAPPAAATAPATAAPSATPSATSTGAAPATSAEPTIRTINRGDTPSDAHSAGKAANSPPSPLVKSTAKSPDIFVPTEEVPGDKAVAFPVDI